MLIAELDLPTLLFGFITMFATAVAYMYKDMRKDMAKLAENAQNERVKCDREIMRLYRELDEIRKLPCNRHDCPNHKK